MRRLLISCLIVAQLAAAPAVAANLIEDRTQVSQQAGSFAGARFRMTLGGGEERGRLRAGLVMAPTLRTQSIDNRSALRFGEGVELGVRQDRPLALSIAGRPLSDLERSRTHGPRAGVSTLGWVAIGTGVVLVAGAVFLYDWARDASE